MILDKLTELQPVAMQQAAAAVMPYIPVSYTARQGKGSAFKAARIKILSLQKGNRVSITDGIITVLSDEEYAARRPSGIRQCIEQLNTTGQCDTSQIWSKKTTRKAYHSRMRGLGWISQQSSGSVIKFIGDEPATVEAFNEYKKKAKRKNDSQANLRGRPRTEPEQHGDLAE